VHDAAATTEVSEGRHVALLCVYIVARSESEAIECVKTEVAKLRSKSGSHLNCR